MASLVTTNRMQQCFNAHIGINHEFLLLFYYCVLLEIKLTTTTITIFMVEHTFAVDEIFVRKFVFTEVLISTITCIISVEGDVYLIDLIIFYQWGEE